jgi:hypothetical protein
MLLDQPAILSGWRARAHLGVAGKGRGYGEQPSPRELHHAYGADVYRIAGSWGRTAESQSMAASKRRSRELPGAADNCRDGMTRCASLIAGAPRSSV